MMEGKRRKALKFWKKMNFNLEGYVQPTRQSRQK